MKYFIAHLLSGEAKGFHESLARELSHTHHTIPLHERIAPHITIKPPFETDEIGIAEVERVLRAFSVGERAPDILFSGFGRFGFRTVYMDIVRSPDAVALARRALKTLNENVSWLPRMPLEGNKLHASVARFLTRRQFRHIWRHLKPMGKPTFSVRFDNIAILVKEGRAWKMHALIPVRLGEDEGYSLPAFTETFEDRLLV